MSRKHANDLPSTEVSAGAGTRMQVLIDAEEGPNFAMRRFIMEPGGGMPLHTNEVEHQQYVLRGRARIVIGDETLEVEPDDAVYLPAGVPPSYDSIGDEPFEFICVVPNREDAITLIDDGC